MAPRRTLAEELAELATPRPAAGTIIPVSRAHWHSNRLLTLTRPSVIAELDLERDEVTEGATLEDADFEFDQDQQPSRYSTRTPARSIM